MTSVPHREYIYGHPRPVTKIKLHFFYFLLSLLPKSDSEKCQVINFRPNNLRYVSTDRPINRPVTRKYVLFYVRKQRDLLEFIFAAAEPEQPSTLPLSEHVHQLHNVMRTAYLCWSSVVQQAQSSFLTRDETKDACLT
jgi:hypothetical protein